MLCSSIRTTGINMSSSNPISGRDDNSFEPIKWNEYFNIRDDIQLETGNFRIYRRGVEGPLLFLIHGGGFSALTWAVFSATITEKVKCQCLAVDMRGHGDSRCTNDEDLSVDTLSKDIIKIIFAMYPTEAPPIILVGHSMGGAVAIHVANKRTIPSLAGLVVIDVVEGSALNSLQGMVGFLRSRPNTFSSLSDAIRWSVRSSQLRNVRSARVSFPGQLKRISTNQTATSELEHGAAYVGSNESNPVGEKSNGQLASSSGMRIPVKQHITTIPESNSELPLPESRLAEDAQQQPTSVGCHYQNEQPHNPARTLDNVVSEDQHLPSLENNVSAALQPGALPLHSKRDEYTWRIDLVKTQQFWKNWFTGLSQMFLSVPEPKLLLLANVDRLDKDLIVGQMQGKFQMHIFPKTGHAVQEDAPDQVAECVAKFLVRNRLTEARSNCGP